MIDFKSLWDDFLCTKGYHLCSQSLWDIFLNLSLYSNPTVPRYIIGTFETKLHEQIRERTRRTKFNPTLSFPFCFCFRCQTRKPATHLISKDADGAGRRNLAGGKPRGGQLGRDAEDEDLGDGHDRLAGEQDQVGVRARAQNLDPTPQAGSQGSNHHRESQTLEEKEA